MEVEVKELLKGKVIVKRLKIKSPPLKNGGIFISPSGEIAQIVNGETFDFLAYIEFKYSPEHPRGNHYHTKKEEFLYIIKGKLRAIYLNIDDGEREELVLETGDLVNVKPRCAHVYYPMEYTQTLEFSSSIFDPLDINKQIVE